MLYELKRESFVKAIERLHVEGGACEMMSAGFRPKHNFRQTNERDEVATEPRCEEMTPRGTSDGPRYLAKRRCSLVKHGEIARR